MSVNKVILVGHLCAEPESRSFPNGGSICNLRLATNERWKDKNSGEQKERVEFHRCTLRNKLGEIAQQYLHKGSQVYLEGRIQTRKWQDSNGQDKYSTEIVCNEMTMLDGKTDGSISNAARGNQASARAAPQPASPQAGDNYEKQQGGEEEDFPF